MNSGHITRPELYLQLSQDYEKIFRLPNVFGTYFINEPEIIYRIFNDHSDLLSKDTLTNRSVSTALGHGLLMMSGQEGIQERKILQPPLLAAQIYKSLSLIGKFCQSYLTSWEAYAEQGKSINISDEMMKMVLLISTQVLFNYHLNSDEINLILSSFKIVHDDATSWRNFFLLPKSKKAERADIALKNMIIKMIEKRLHESDSSQSYYFIDYILNEYDFYDKQTLVIDECRTFLATGHETTGVALSWLWYLLGRNQAVYKNLLTEVDQFSSTNLLLEDDFKKLDYTKAIFDETLRLYPPIWLVSRRLMQSLEIEGYSLKQGKELLVSSYALHHQERLFENPEKFLPERFLKANRSKIVKSAYIPFGIGPRSCIASSLAKIMAVSIIFYITKKYCLQLIEPNKHIDYESKISLRPKEGVWMVLKRRK